jgi:adenylate kinase family enzyme
MCDKLYHDPELAHQNLYHLSVGAYLRELRDTGLLDTHVAQDLAEQKLISGETLVKMIEEKATDECMHQGHRVMLLDGFPRNQEQMERFTEKVSHIPHPSHGTRWSQTSYVLHSIADVLPNTIL